MGTEAGGSNRCICPGDTPPASLYPAVLQAEPLPRTLLPRSLPSEVAVRHSHLMRKKKETKSAEVACCLAKARPTAPHSWVLPTGCPFRGVALAPGEQGRSCIFSSSIQPQQSLPLLLDSLVNSLTEQSGSSAFRASSRASPKGWGSPSDQLARVSSPRAFGLCRGEEGRMMGLTSLGRSLAPLQPRCSRQ